jgi:hypothetical protein
MKGAGNWTSHGKLFRIYIDESGDHTYHMLGEPAKRYLGLTGCIVGAEYYRVRLHGDLEALKQKHFPHDPDEPVILHRNEIINCRGPFWRLRDAQARTRFNEDILRFLHDQQYRLITVVIDKKSHQERYGPSALHPYHYCLAALLERYCGFLNFYNARGDVMAENRQGAEDRKLQAAYTMLHEAGTQWRGRDFFCNVLTSKKLKLKSKAANIAGLQVADLLAYPSKQEVLVEQARIDRMGTFGATICAAIAGKYNQHVRDGRVKGYGKVFLK